MRTVIDSNVFSAQGHVALFKLKTRLWLSSTGEIMLKVMQNKMALAAMLVVAAFGITALFADYIAPYSPDEISLENRFCPPSWVGAHPLGTDHLGRDILTRMVYGARVSIAVGFLTVGISALVGTTLGVISGYYGGWLDSLLTGVTEILLAFPYLIFAIGAMAALGPGFWNLIWALSFKGWVEFYRLARAGVLSEKSREYVEAARLLGRSDSAIIVTEIMPNMINPILIVATLRIGSMMVMESSLSFLGIGIPPRIPTWGSMIRDGQRFILNAPWLSIIPGVALLLLVLSLNTIGEAFRDVLDPELKEV